MEIFRQIMSSKKTLMMTYGYWMERVWLLASIVTLNISRWPWKPPQKGTAPAVRKISEQLTLQTKGILFTMPLELDVARVHGTFVMLPAVWWTFRREKGK